MLIGYALNVVPNGKSNKLEAQEFSSKFFLNPINKSARSWSLGQENGWQFELVGLFTDISEHASYFCCAYSATQQPLLNEDLHKLLGPKLRGFEFGNTLLKVFWGEGQIEQLRPVVSNFLRNSNTLDINDFKDLNALSFVADGQGLAVVEKTLSESSLSRALRLLHLICLAGSYLVVMNKATDKLADAAMNKHGSEAELKSWTTFLAKYYSSEPVRSTGIELIHFYPAIRDRLRIEDHYRELTEQLKMHSDVVMFERHEKNTDLFNELQKRLSKLGLYVALAGVFIGVLSALFAALTLSPKQVATAWSQWKNCLSHSWSACTREEKSNATQTGFVSPAEPASKLKSNKSSSSSRP